MPKQEGCQAAPVRGCSLARELRLTNAPSSKYMTLFAHEHRSAGEDIDQPHSSTGRDEDYHPTRWAKGEGPLYADVCKDLNLKLENGQLSQS